MSHFTELLENGLGGACRVAQESRTSRVSHGGFIIGLITSAIGRARIHLASREEGLWVRKIFSALSRRGWYGSRWAVQAAKDWEAWLSWISGGRIPASLRRAAV